MFSLAPIPPTTPSRFVAQAAPVAPATQGSAVALDAVTDAFHAMLDAQSALNPIRTMIYRPGEQPIQPDYDTALAAVDRGVSAIERALAAYPVVRNAARTALESAALDAHRGHALLTMDPRLEVVRDPAAMASAFNAAANWLDAAGNLLALELGRPGFEPFATR